MRYMYWNETTREVGVVEYSITDTRVNFSTSWNIYRVIKLVMRRKNFTHTPGVPQAENCLVGIEEQTHQQEDS